MEVNEGEWIRLKEKIRNAALSNGGGGTGGIGRDRRSTVEK